MSWIFKRFRVVISISLILSIFIAYLIIYLPMNNELKTAALSTFIAEARFGERTASGFIDNCRESAIALSERAELREHLIDFHAGRISSGRLKTEAQPLFLLAVESIRGIEGAFRIANGMQAASYGTGNSSMLSPSDGVNAFNMIVDTQNYKLVVYSPIDFNGKNLGYDVLFFDLKKVFDSINADRNIFSLTESGSSDFSSTEGISAIDINGVYLFDDGKNIIYSHKLGETGVNLTAKVSKARLNVPIRKMSVDNLITAVIWYVILLLITNWIIIRYVRFKLNQAEKTKELYKEYAYRDTLTGAFSRLYFDQWSKSRIEKYGFINEDICVVMIDINRYKFINDTYGHAAGDKALARVSKILQMSVKEEDLVVRYGGDEFLMVLVNCTYDEANRILSKISGSMLKIDDINFGISISYGIEYISSYKDLKAAVHRADEKMYESKNAYNALLNF